MKINLNQDFSDYIYNRVSNKVFNEKEKGVKRKEHWDCRKHFRKKNSYKVFMRILNKFIGFHHNDAFSYYCSIESDREKRELFLGHLNFVITHTVYRYYRSAGFKYQVVDGIILRVEMKQKPRVIYSHDYKTETIYVDKHGIERDKKIRWLNWNGIDKWTETKKIISGQKYHFDSKNNYLYKRLWKEKEQAKLKVARNEIKIKVHPNNFKYCIVHKPKIGPSLNYDEVETLIIKPTKPNCKNLFKKKETAQEIIDKQCEQFKEELLVTYIFIENNNV